MAQDSRHLQMDGRNGEESSSRGELLGYGLAFLCVAVATGLALGVRAWDGEVILFPFFIAIIVTAWISGPLPAWIATVIAVLVVDYVFTPPYNSFAVSLEALPNFIGFALCLGITCLIVAQKRRSDALISEITHQHSEKRQSELSLLREANAALSDRLAQRDEAAAVAETLFEHSEILMLRLDAAGRLRDLNPAAARILGLGRPAALGKAGADLLVPEAERARFQERLVAARQQPSDQDLGIWPSPTATGARIRWTCLILARGEGGQKGRDESGPDLLCLGVTLWGR